MTLKFVKILELSLICITYYEYTRGHMERVKWKKYIFVQFLEEKFQSIECKGNINLRLKFLLDLIIVQAGY